MMNSFFKPLLTNQGFDPYTYLLQSYVYNNTYVTLDNFSLHFCITTYNMYHQVLPILNVLQ